MRKTILFLLLACSTLFGAAQPRTYSPLQYRVALNLNFKDKSLSGHEEILLRTLIPLKELPFEANEITVSKVSSEAAAIDNWSQRDGRLLVSLKQELPAGTSLRLHLDYSGKPVRGVSWGETSVQALYSTDHWMVCDFSPAGLARLDLTLESPENLQVAASGRRIGTRRQNGRQFSHWRQDEPVTPFVLGFAVGRMQEAVGHAGKTTLRFLSEKHTPQQMAKIFSNTQAAIRFYEQVSGVKLGGTYTQVLAPGDPMQELAQMTVLSLDYGDNIEQDPTDVNLLAHELSHQWWAVRVPCADWADFWLNEGMADFMADAFLEHQYGREAYARAGERHRQIYLDTIKAGKDRALYFPAWKKPEDASGPIAYHKGAWVLHLLRQEIGDEAFWNGLRNYTRGHVGLTATTQDFQYSMETACGHSLQDFFNEWVYGTGSLRMQ